MSIVQLSQGGNDSRIRLSAHHIRRGIGMPFSVTTK